jgi:TetR/AcrR family transcriptional regulator, regulator of cefoperazone and chloramphenicol sensitivity
MSAELESSAERILEAAGPLFADLDYELVSVRDIAAEAKVHFSAINYHFGSKDRLYQKVLEQAATCKDVSEYVAAHEGDFSNPREQLREIIRRMLGSYINPRDDKWKMRLMAREMFKPSPHNATLRQYWEPGMRHMMGLMCELRGIPADSEEAMFHSGMVFMLVDSIGQSREMIEQYVNHPVELDWMVDRILELFR